MVKKLIEILKHRELIENLVKRDLKTRYKVSILGFLWSLLRPLFMMIIFWVVFSKVFRGDINMNAPYPLFLLCAILPWQFLTTALNSGANSLLSNESLIKKVNLPREIFPLSAVLAELVNFLLSLIVLTPFLFIFHIGISVWILFLPVLIFIEFILVFGIALLVSSLNVFFRDTLAILDLWLMAWFYLSPVFYSVNLVQTHVSVFNYKLFLLNPMTPFMTGFRKSLLANGFLSQNGFGYDFNEWFVYMMIATGISLVIFIIGWIVFQKLDKQLVDTI